MEMAEHPPSAPAPSYFSAVKVLMLSCFLPLPSLDRDLLLDLLFSWPLSDETIFPEFLAGSCQYMALQEYVRLLRSWCTWNDAAAMFFLGLSYLYFE